MTRPRSFNEGVFVGSESLHRADGISRTGRRIRFHHLGDFGIDRPQTRRRDRFRDVTESVAVGRDRDRLAGDRLLLEVAHDEVFRVVNSPRIDLRRFRVKVLRVFVRGTGVAGLGSASPFRIALLGRSADLFPGVGRGQERAFEEARFNQTAPVHLHLTRGDVGRNLDFRLVVFGRQPRQFDFLFVNGRNDHWRFGLDRYGRFSLGGEQRGFDIQSLLLHDGQKVIPFYAVLPDVSLEPDFLIRHADGLNAHLIFAINGETMALVAELEFEFVHLRPFPLENLHTAQAVE